MITSMWESAKTKHHRHLVSAIVKVDVDDNFVINSTYLKMIWENKFDGYLWADPHDHIRKFLAIYNMFRYGETQSEAVKLLIFPFSLCDEAKTWFNELKEESITSWEQMRRAFINIFFPPLLFNRLLLEIRNFSQLDSYSPQSLHNPNDSEKSLTELNNDLKNDLEDFKRYIRSMRTVHDKHFTTDDGKTTGVLPQSKTDFEKSITKLLDRQRVTNMFFKNNVNDMILKIKQIENNFQTKIKNMQENRCGRSPQNILFRTTKKDMPSILSLTPSTVNVVFTRSGKSADSSKIQTLPPIIVEDKPIKTQTVAITW
ncbi:reverse transcriptase domain-containing protein [Tanacetum coccineum]